jgi:NADPH-dependent curcumin reductase CurA
MLDTVVKHKIRVRHRVFHGIDEIPKAVEMLHNGQYQGKGVIVIDEEIVKKEQGLL